MSPLAYDDSAFNYFALTVVIVFTVPYTLSVLGELMGSKFKARPNFGPEEAEKARLVNRKDRWVYIKLFFALLLCGLAFYLVKLVRAHGIVAKFDPFEILQIEDREANVSFIKKQYRRLSLIYHPDKNIGPKAVAAGEMFQKIAKAYEALTDETSKENWEKYGNPDGKQALEVAIGLPKWLLKYPKLVMVMYLLSIVVAIPYVVYAWYSNSQKYGGHGIYMETYYRWDGIVSDELRAEMVQDGYAGADRLSSLPTLNMTSEFQAIKGAVDGKECDELFLSSKIAPYHDEIIQISRKKKVEARNGNTKTYSEEPSLLEKDFKNDLIRKENITPLKREGVCALQCLLGYIYRSRELDKSNGAKEFALELALLFRKIFPGMFDKFSKGLAMRMPITKPISIIRASQCVVQAVGVEQDPLLQLPGVTPLVAEQIRNYYKGMGKTDYDVFRTLLEDVKEDAPKLKENIYSLFESNSSFREQNFKAVCAHGFPLLNVSYEILPPDVDEKSVYSTDVFSIKVTLKLDSYTAEPYCPRFPDLVAGNYFLFLTSKPQTGGVDVNAPKTAGLYYEPANDYLFCHENFSADVISHADMSELSKDSLKFKHRFDVVGTQRLYIWVLSDFMRGLDQVIAVDIDIKPLEDKPQKEIQPKRGARNEEDGEDSDDEPSFFSMAQAMQQQQGADPDDVSTDEESEDER